MKKAFTLIELLVVIVVIAILTAVALPYYQNAIALARNSEAMVWWGQVKRFGGLKKITAARAQRWENEANQRLKTFTLKFVCREKEEQEESESCWEAELQLKNTTQRIQYFLTTQHNFSELVCVGLNPAGKNFCQTLSGNENEPDTIVAGKEGYLIRD